jgi:hypothetical protein
MHSVTRDNFLILIGGAGSFSFSPIETSQEIENGPVAMVWVSIVMKL